MFNKDLPDPEQSLAPLAYGKYRFKLQFRSDMTFVALSHAQPPHDVIRCESEWNVYRIEFVKQAQDMEGEARSLAHRTGLHRDAAIAGRTE